MTLISSIRLLHVALRAFLRPESPLYLLSYYPRSGPHYLDYCNSFSFGLPTLRISSVSTIFLRYRSVYVTSPYLPSPTMVSSSINLLPPYMKAFHRSCPFIHWDKFQKEFDNWSIWLICSHIGSKESENVGKWHLPRRGPSTNPPSKYSGWQNIKYRTGFIYNVKDTEMAHTWDQGMLGEGTFLFLVDYPIQRCALYSCP